MLCLSGFELYSRWVPLIVCQMNIMRTDKITKRFTVNVNLVSLSITRHSKK